MENKQYLLDTNILIEFMNGNSVVADHILRASGNLVDEFDMLIGGQALTAGLIVVTDNVKHFDLMPGLKVENRTERTE